ncbi:energy transducer TonB [Azospirillum sp.]|uniref:energy transducer TonB n=1 Tax=Azospirillum sp. TaxID=34012 RepID=UPI002D72A918|nr:energy transducer TonB [Azospirillum sp.]HYD69399.1 energy transducer TonB [Azospirillum sp.]
MTAPERSRQPGRRGAIIGVAASLALHAAALAAVIAGSGDRAPQAPGRVAAIAVDIVAPPMPPAPAPDIAEAPAPESPTPESPEPESPAPPERIAEAPDAPAPLPEPAPATDAAPVAPTPAEPMAAEPPPAAPPARKPKPAQAHAAAALSPRSAAPAAPAAASGTPGTPGPATATPPVSGPAGPTVAAAPLDSPQPSYPAAARRRGQQGRVVLSVRVSPSGSPEAVVLVASSGVDALDEAARDAVRTWRFRPALDRGVAVAATVEVPVRFRLEED